MDFTLINWVNENTTRLMSCSWSTASIIECNCLGVLEKQVDLNPDEINEVLTLVIGNRVRT